MSENLCWFAVLVALTVASALVVTALVRRHLRALLDEVIRLPSGATFYSRVFGIGVLFIALSAAFDVPFDLKPDAATMEYVWKVADGLSSALSLTCLFLTAYLLLITILTAVLKGRHD
ncbi:MAG: hypothetical protein AB1640_24295 [bacterium]